MNKLTAPFNRQNFNTHMLNPDGTRHCTVEECVLTSPAGDRQLLVLLRRVEDGSRADYGSIQLSKLGEESYYGYREWKDTKWMGDLTADECQAYVDRKVKEWQLDAAPAAQAPTQLALFA